MICCGWFRLLERILGQWSLFGRREYWCVFFMTYCLVDFVMLVVVDEGLKKNVK